MWVRSELKARAKAAFKANYWKCVLVALILAVLVGGGAGSSVRKNESAGSQADQQQAVEMLSGLGMEDAPMIQSMLEDLTKTSVRQSSRITISLGGLGLAGLLLSILVFNPIIVGCYRFFLLNSRGGAELNELGSGFKGDWGNVILVMFLRNLFLALWTLLFIIPGIVKSYSYRLVPYLVKDHPELTGTQAIKMSRQLMRGHKWNAFVLDLSFIGWFLLSALTLGILHVFYVGPYVQATDAELYRAITEAYDARLAAETAA